MSDANTATQQIRIVRDGPIGWLVLNRPEKHNALTAAMWHAIPSAIAELDGDIDVRVIIIRGAGRAAFAAGADISEFAGNRSGAAAARAYEATNTAALMAIADAAKPVIAMIHGHCVGGGFAIALACDMRVGADTASFCLPPARLGLAYPLDGLRQLLSATTPAIAKELIFTARRIEAGEALRLGLVNRVTGEDELEAETARLCRAIAANAPLTIRASKSMINDLAANPESIDRDKLDAAAGACFESADYREGQAAFVERRTPRFRGL